MLRTQFIEVWRRQESGLQTNRLTDILLSNARHEVRTPLNHIIKYVRFCFLDPFCSDALQLS
jgi:signal transduction histidine kinase